MQVCAAHGLAGLDHSALCRSLELMSDHEIAAGEHRGMNAPMTLPDPRTQPQAFLRSLYDAAVRRAMPLHNMAAVLPPVPKGRTLVLGAGKAGAAMMFIRTCTRLPSNPSQLKISICPIAARCAVS